MKRDGYRNRLVFSYYPHTVLRLHTEIPAVNDTPLRKPTRRHSSRHRALRKRFRIGRFRHRAPSAHPLAKEAHRGPVTQMPCAQGERRMNAPRCHDRSEEFPGISNGPGDRRGLLPQTAAHIIFGRHVERRNNSVVAGVFAARPFAAARIDRPTRPNSHGPCRGHGRVRRGSAHGPGLPCQPIHHFVVGFRLLSYVYFASVRHSLFRSNGFRASAIRPLIGQRTKCRSPAGGRQGSARRGRRPSACGGTGTRRRASF